MEITITGGEVAGISPEALFEQVSAQFSAPLARLANAHEADPSLAQDLLQEIHIAIWRSLPSFGGRSALRTWVYRVAHNTAISHVRRRGRRAEKNLVELESVEISSEARDVGVVIDEQRMLARIHALLRRLKPIDREVFLLYLEGVGADDIAEIAGLSTTNTGTKIHRIKKLLSTELDAGVDP